MQLLPKASDGSGANGCTRQTAAAKFRTSGSRDH